MPRNRLRTGMLVVGMLLTVPWARADWPQILGTRRDGQAPREQIEVWGKEGPQTLWQMDVGSGYAGAAARGERVVIFHRIGGELVAQALSLDTGKPLWKATFETNYRSSIAPDDGPRCVPLIHGNQVFLYGPAGELACVALDSGRTLWSRQVYQDFDAPEGYFGAGSTPIVEDEKLLVNVGARGAGIVAFGLEDGKTLWKATDEAASYSSPVTAQFGGVRQVIFVTRLNVVSLDAKTGKVFWTFPFGQRGPTVNAANPLVLGDHLFLTASYGVGARWLKVGADGATAEWENDTVMSSQYTTCVEKEGYLYGLDGRQDGPPAHLRCFSPSKAKVLWSEDDFGTGNLILAGDKLLVMKTDGELVLVRPSPQEYRPLAKARLFDTTVQALPALSNGLLLARDTKTLKCVVVGKR